MEPALSASGVIGWLFFASSIIAGIGVPVMLFLVGINLSRRQSHAEELRTRLTHLDDCIDTLRTTLLGSGVNRSDFMQFRAEMAETLTRMRAAISQEQTDQNQRIQRLENRYFRGEEQ